MNVTFLYNESLRPLQNAVENCIFYSCYQEKSEANKTRYKLLFIYIYNIYTHTKTYTHTIMYKLVYFRIYAFEMRNIYLTIEMHIPNTHTHIHTDTHKNNTYIYIHTNILYILVNVLNLFF